MKNIQVSAFVLVLMSSSLIAQNCADFIVLDRYSSSSSYTVYEKTKDVVCSNTIADRSSAFNAGIKAGIPIPVLDDIFSLNFSGNTASTNWSHWQQEFCHSYYHEQSAHMQNSNLAQLFSDNAKSVVETCLNREPVYAFFEVPPNAESFTFTFHVQGKEKLKNGFILPATAVKDCSPENPFALTWWYKNVGDLDISGEKKAFSCSWNSNVNARVELKLQNQGDRAYTLPAVVKRQTPPPPPPLVVSPETYRSDELPSGACEGWSNWYTICSDGKPEGWTIASHTFQMVGNRSCSSWGHCEPTTLTSTKVCYRFQMQGHSEECGHSGNTGIQYSRGVLDVTWQHH